jgi:hypothetical protein
LALRITCFLILLAWSFYPHQALADSQEREAVLATVERFFTAMRTRDADTWEEILVPEGHTWRWRRDDQGDWVVSGSTNAAGTASLRTGDDRYDERMFAPTVLIRGPVAVVWTPYTFHLNGRFSHCGIDAFNLMKMDGRWRLADAMWTVEPDEAACRGWLPPTALEQAAPTAPGRRP